MDELKIPTTPSSDEVLDTLAALLPHEYEPVRLDFAKRLKFRPVELDKEVRRRRKFLFGEEAETLAGSAVVFADLEPWDKSVTLAKLLDELSQLIRDYIVFQNGHDPDMLALWCVVTYCSHLFNIAPLVGVTAISRECGKTSLLRILLYLVNKGIGTVSLTEATAFRLVDKHHPTLIADEIDKWLRRYPELLTIFLAGHEREFANVYRCAGDDAEERWFNCFGPKAWGQIGIPDEQLVSRSLVVSLLKKKPTEKVKSWPKIGMPAEVNDVFVRLQRQAARWVRDSEEAIKSSQPDVCSLDNGLHDNWYPLLVIASLAGPDWKRRALEAAGVEAVISESGEEITLLRDLRNIFHTHAVDRLPSRLLLCDLLLQPESPWRHYEKQPDGLTPQQLGFKLRQMGVKSENMRFDHQHFMFDQDKNQLKGYKLEWFANLFERQLAGEQPEDVTVQKVDKGCF
jgi:hypothetical protein